MMMTRHRMPASWFWRAWIGSGASTIIHSAVGYRAFADSANSASRDSAILLRRSVDEFDDLAATGECEFSDITDRIARLPAKIRMIAEGILAGETIPEIANNLKLPEGTVRNRVKRFRQHWLKFASV